MDTNFKDGTPCALQPTLLEAYDYDLNQLQQRVGIDRAASTLVRQRQIRCHLVDFLTRQMHCPDIVLTELTPRFIYDYANFLSTECRLRGGTVWLSCQHLKGVVTRAYQRGLMTANPFYAFHIGKNIREREFLTEQELLRLMACQLDNPSQAFYRDIFVFSALTGMTFIDICHLRHSDIHDVNGEAWIFGHRQKTQTLFQVKLLPAALDIIHRHAQPGEQIFAPLTYRTLAKHIPLIIQACGITKHITFHCARHTFAVTALNAGLPIESVSRVLGHSNISTTQIYAKITLQKLGRDMERLGSFLDTTKDEKVMEREDANTKPPVIRKKDKQPKNVKNQKNLVEKTKNMD